MIKIILASESTIKENALKQWLKEIIKKQFSIKKINIEDNLLPPQPINSGGKLNCSDRIKFVYKNLGEKIERYDYVIAIENSLVTRENKLVDVVHIIIKDVLTNKEFNAEGGEIEITYKLLNDFGNIPKILDDLISNYELTSTNYIFDGCEKTFGELVNKYYPNIQSNNWMKKFCDVDRKTQIISVLEFLQDVIV